MTDAPDAPLAATHPNGAPQPDDYQQHVPFTFRYTRLAFGTPPEQVTELRNLIYTHFAYGKLAEALGIDLGEMATQTRKMRKRHAELTKKHGKKQGDVLFTEEFSGPGGMASALGTVGDVKIDDLQQVAAMVWAGLITEDPTITREQVLKMITAANQTDVLLAAVKAINVYLHGARAASVDYASIKADIEKGLTGDPTEDDVQDALGIESEEDAAEAASVRQARSETATAGDADPAGDGTADGAPGNGPAA